MRCVNIDWLEIYALESLDRYPCNAEYFRQKGYIVREREYGTRIYNEMFTILDDNLEPMIEVRRNPKSGESSFSGLIQTSTHIRLPNWKCYHGNPIEFMRDFLLRHDYQFKRIFRIDICYDFEFFDSGDQPARFARRYLARTFRKINQCKVSTHGNDGWNDFEWETISWGKPTSMVSTKLYNKTKELSREGHDKPYIKTDWMVCGLIDNPVDCSKRRRDGSLYYPEIWRVEFSMKSSADNWIVIEDQSGKKERKKAIPHTLSLFDSKEKIWQRFQDLAFHYFHFKYREYKDEEKALIRLALNKDKPAMDKELKRKDRCRDKVLFHFDKDHQFSKLSMVAASSKTEPQDMTLLRKLRVYKFKCSDAKVRTACETLIETLEREKVRGLAPHHLNWETDALQRAIALKLGGDMRSTLEIIAELKEVIQSNSIF